MITESFVNACFTVIFTQNKKIKKDKTLYRDILDIVTFYIKSEGNNIPFTIKTKIECLIKVCQMKMDDKGDANILDSMSISEKYKDLTDFIETKITIELDDVAINDNVRQIRLRKKLNTLFSNYGKLEDFLGQIKDGTFESMDDVVLDYEVIVKELYSNMMEHNRGLAIASSCSLDLAKDNYSSVVEMLKKKYERKNTTPTGFDILDGEVLNGGLEPSRLYVVGGGSGAGKSTIMINWMLGGARKQVENAEQLPLINGVNKVFVYITLENTIEESLLRLYQAMFKKTQVEVLHDIANFGDDYIQAGNFIKTNIMNELQRNNATIIMKYYPAMTISPLDIMNVIDEVQSDYAPEYIKGLYVDYLDLLCTDVKYDMHRLELGHITLSMKTLAVQYNIPVVVGSQLGRSVYKVQHSRDLSLDQMSESIKKVEHADFVALLSKDPVEERLVHMNIGKNRSGKANIPIDWKVDFASYRFINGSVPTNQSKQDSTNEKTNSFTDAGNRF